MRLILIDSRAGQSEDCTRPSCKLRIKTVGQHLINLSFNFTGANPWRVFRSMSQMKAHNFLNVPREKKQFNIDIYVLLPNRPKHGRYIFKQEPINYHLGMIVNTNLCNGRELKNQTI